MCSQRALGWGLLLTMALAPLARADCFSVFPSPPTFQTRTACTNHTCLVVVRAFLAAIFIPSGEPNCSNACSMTNFNVTVTGGDLLGFGANPPQVPPEGSLVVFDCLFQQTPGATNALIIIQSPCVSLTNSFTYPELIFLTAQAQPQLVSNVCLCWNSRTNTMYQVQQRADVAQGMWEDLGTPVTGNGTTNCVMKAVLAPPTFYRVKTVP
jgi:hypothetical protein